MGEEGVHVGVYVGDEGIYVGEEGVKEGAYVGVLDGLHVGSHDTDGRMVGLRDGARDEL